MITNEKTILVYWDFSKNAKHALSHALFYSSQANFDIYLLHVVKDEAKAKNTKIKLDKTAQNIFEEEGHRIKTIVKVGYLSNAIKNASEELNSVIIFGGLPNYKGLKQFIGRYIMNGILGANIPSVVVQKPRTESKQLTIICPIDHKRNCKASLEWIQKIAKICLVKIYLTYPDCTYSLKTQMVKSNLSFARNYLNQLHIEFEEQQLACQGFRLNLLNFAESQKVELILDIAHKESRLKNIFLKSENYKLLINQKQIPVMSISPKKGLWRYGGFNR